MLNCLNNDPEILQLIHVHTVYYTYDGTSSRTIRGFHVAKTGADQLCSYCKADIRLCFRICKMLVFSFRGSYMYVKADQRFYFRYTDGANSSKILNLKLRHFFCYCTGRSFVLDLVGNPTFSRDHLALILHVVERRTPNREVLGSIPTGVFVLCH